jgi:succinate dehydrogenase/fumarate reductase flavoprotein subunit
VLALDEAGDWQAFRAENVILAVGGFGGLYEASVYPAVHTGAIGVALRAGVCAQNLPESQFGLASVRFRWNVSGTYMQVVPRVFSTAADGHSDAREFLQGAFASPGEAYSQLFLKGYQWPFDVRKAATGSSRIDLLVHEERVLKGRRVFLDFRANGSGFNRPSLSAEARAYLDASGAKQRSPLARLLHMNPAAVALYREHGIDLAREPLEIAVCAQHNNGGLAANLWWESLNVKHLFPVGEVNGSHGVGRPGGAALNAGQVGGLRAADYIAAEYGGASLSDADFKKALAEALTVSRAYAAACEKSKWSWRECRREFQARMTQAGAHLRCEQGLVAALRQARAQCKRLEADGCQVTRPRERIRAFENRQLCLAHVIYLSAQLFAIRSGAGSRGSALVKDADGHPVAENPGFRQRVQETRVLAAGGIRQRWVPRRPLPDTDLWFETAWASFVRGDRYRKQ